MATKKQVRKKKKDEILTTEHVLRSLEEVEDWIRAIRWALESGGMKLTVKLKIPRSWPECSPRSFGSSCPRHLNNPNVCP